MRKFHWADLVMSAGAYIEQAVWWSKELTRFRSRGPGDIDNAMRAIERDYGLDYNVLWRLRYRSRQFKDIGVSLYARLEAAYRAECERQHDKLTAELTRARPILGPAHKAVVAAEAVVGRGADEAPGAPRDAESVSGRAELAKEDGDGGWKTGDGERQASTGYKT